MAARILRNPPEPPPRPDNRSSDENADASGGLSFLLDALESPVISRRREGRYPLTTEVLVAPCDEHGVPNGDAVSMVTCDLAPSGVGLLHTEPFESEYLVMVFKRTPLARVRLLVRLIDRAVIGQLHRFSGVLMRKI
ncbi:hypothetical protein Mal64_39510 [Pseudobythopirellula maris]|uniref:PilZ domain-containing protein n=1 Tax=Pseudobythopirellula maris TaxID=2527991 RepID=A0A5C5ZGD8_9BACT|nr:hypothetical protein [Pseudobythopirellula maris]TWT86208.1 hypothetical protein Mal64_39510 [Pseudobythopirellula maris]